MQNDTQLSIKKILFFIMNENNVKNIYKKQIDINYYKKIIVNNIIKNIVIYLDLTYGLVSWTRDTLSSVFKNA
jgi:hypothetical protein